MKCLKELYNNFILYLLLFFLSCKVISLNRGFFLSLLTFIANFLKPVFS